MVQRIAWVCLLRCRRFSSHTSLIPDTINGHSTLKTKQILYYSSPRLPLRVATTITMIMAVSHNTFISEKPTESRQEAVQSMTTNSLCRDEEDMMDKSRGWVGIEVGVQVAVKEIWRNFTASD